MKQQVPTPPQSRGLTPLASCLLENFANRMSVSWLHISPHACACMGLMFCQFLLQQLLLQPRDLPSRLWPMAATQSGATGDDLQELAGLGHFGANASHIASQMERKYCKSPDIDLLFPYLLECPVKVGHL